MKITIGYEVTSCSDCPHIETGRTYGNDGRDGTLVYKCKKGVFGGNDGWGDFGERIKPKVPPYGCPYFTSKLMERVASKLGIDVAKLKEILAQEHCEIKEI
ncbi:MAG: hypothetical protein ACRC7N_13705 [Clostridium sp.]